ncbi:hypothetical protein CEXT_125641 [Caerostris extrusa]|uniref:Uncharacterized protein n=1 Tax=Caerostris extrusa TaxID=172846 RepID=A0AAV4QYI8_CAEEX|nr:hypothetical protein CEXT_125641 [Caerostris extrusa]
MKTLFLHHNSGVQDNGELGVLTVHDFLLGSWFTLSSFYPTSWPWRGVNVLRSKDPLVTSNRKPVCDVRYSTGPLKYGGRQSLYGLISIFWVEGEVLLLVRLDKGCRCKVARGQSIGKIVWDITAGRILHLDGLA